VFLISFASDGDLQVNGAADFSYARVGNSFIVKHAKFLGWQNEQHGFIATGMSVARAFTWRDVTLQNRAQLDLSNASVGAGQLCSSSSGYGHRPLLAFDWSMLIIVLGWAAVLMGKRAGVMRLTWQENLPPPSAISMRGFIRCSIRSTCFCLLSICIRRVTGGRITDRKVNVPSPAAASRSAGRPCASICGYK
jgi:hypothetical protein